MVTGPAAKVVAVPAGRQPESNAILKVKQEIENDVGGQNWLSSRSPKLRLPSLATNFAQVLENEYW
jgi:hypothetical protein